MHWLCSVMLCLCFVQYQHTFVAIFFVFLFKLKRKVRPLPPVPLPSSRPTSSQQPFAAPLARGGKRCRERLEGREKGLEHGRSFCSMVPSKVTISQEVPRPLSKSQTPRALKECGLSGGGTSPHQTNHTTRARKSKPKPHHPILQAAPLTLWPIQCRAHNKA